MTDQGKTALVSAGAPLLLEISELLAACLGLPSGAIPATPETRILGAIPEMDSMSVVAVLLSLEEEYDIVVHDDEVDAEIFESLGNLAAFVSTKLD
jgi:acyl carrier protein